MIRQTADGLTLAVRVQPGARKTAILGIYGDGDLTNPSPSAQLKIAVQSPPIEGRANQALIAFLAETFHLARSSVELVSGASSRSKVFLLRDLTLPQAQSILAPLL